MPFIKVDLEPPLVLEAHPDGSLTEDSSRILRREQLIAKQMKLGHVLPHSTVPLDITPNECTDTSFTLQQNSPDEAEGGILTEKGELEIVHRFAPGSKIVVTLGEPVIEIIPASSPTYPRGFSERTRYVAAGFVYLTNDGFGVDSLQTLPGVPAGIGN